MRTEPLPQTAQLLILAQWLSPAFPLGSFAWSHGLEQAVADRQVSDARDLRRWLRDVLRDGSGRSDAIFLRLAFACPPEALAALDARARAFQPAAERRAEAERQGAAFVRTTNAVWGTDMPDLLLPLAVGQGARHLGLDVETTVPIYLHSFASALVSAAQRLMPVGQNAAQAVIAALHPVCAEIAQATKGAGAYDLYSNAFLSDIAAMRHETLQPRLFQS